MAMPHWGMALALGPNINLDVDPAREKQAYDLAQVALRRSLSRTRRRRSRRYIRTLIAALFE